MPLSSTIESLRAASTLRRCEALTTGPGYVLVPDPGAGAFTCPHPCGGKCPHAARAKALPPPPPRAHEVRVRLRLAETHEQLLSAALRPAPALACDLDAPDATPALLSGMRPHRN